MKKLFLIFCLALPFNIFAQPVIQAFTPIFGVSINVYDITDSIPINFPLSGNQTWDFSNAVTQPTFSISLLDPATTPYSSDFPGANFAQSINSGPTPMAYFYGVISADSLYGLGARSMVIPTANLTYTNPNVSFRFPMAYQSTISDLSVTDQGEVEYDTRTYIAYGDVITPFGNYPNAVMFRDQSFDSAGAWISTKYIWLSAANLNTIIEIDSSDGTGTTYDLSALTSIGQKQIKEKYKLAISPNPSINTNCNLQISLNETEEVSVELIAIDGKHSTVILPKQKLLGTKIIPLHTISLAKGLYFARISVGNEVLVEKIILE